MRYEILNEETPTDLLHSIVEFNTKWLMYMPVCRKGIDICLECIKKDFLSSQYLPAGIKQNHEILDYQKSLGKINIISKLYNMKKDLFTTKIKVLYESSSGFLGDSRLSVNSYTVMVEFRKFNEFYSFLDGNLYDAELRNYKFEGIDLKLYKIGRAHV